MADLLSASSLVLAALGLVYSSWYPSLSSNIQSKISIHPSDRGLEKAETKRLLQSKAIPLAMASLLFSAAILPDFIRSICVAFSVVSGEIGYSNYSYDAVTSLYCVTVLISIGLSIHLINLVRQLKLRLREIEKSD